MKFKRIRTRMLVFVIPVLVIVILVSCIFSITKMTESVSAVTEDYMNATLDGSLAEVEQFLNRVGTTAEAETAVTAGVYKSASVTELETMLINVVDTWDSILGSGYWFEPYAYNSAAEYYGPYAYRDTDIVITYDYSGDYSGTLYDYFNEEYYISASKASGATFTDPYYDETSGTVMMTCAAPILDDGKYVGCVTVDMEISDIQSEITALKVGEEGFAFLLSSSGTFLGYKDEEKIASANNITDDENSSLAAAGELILASESGTTSYTEDGETYNVYWGTISQTGWKLAVTIPKSEITDPIISLTNILVISNVLVIVLVAVVILVLLNSMSRGINRVKLFAGTLAKGDFTADELEVKSVDEVGQLSESLNTMFEANKSVIMEIADHSVSIQDASNKLSAGSTELSAKFSEIMDYMSSINEAMMSTSAATQEVNASVEEIHASVNLLAEEATSSAEMADDIKKRAYEVETSSKSSFETASKLSTQYDLELKKSLEKAEVVESIGELAEVISGIAEQINLLSLNASIEAARAGEQGKGFAVVATEIGKLASETSEAVEKIQVTITSVKDAFNQLTNGVRLMLDFINDTVTPDYSHFVSIGKQYGVDADTILEMARKINSMTENINSTMKEITDAITNVAESTQTTAENSSNSMQAVDSASGVVDDIANMSEIQNDISNQLNEVVGNFKL